MLKKSLILQLFRGFSIQRWNDQIRPVPLVEMDKNGHKMAIAYCLGRYEAAAGQIVNWHNIIRGGVFELLRRSVLSDIKSPIYSKLRAQHPEIFQKLSQWVYDQLEPMFSNAPVLSDLKAYLTSDDLVDPLSNDILAASHILASYWEFQVIRRANPDSNAIARIESMMFLDLAPYAKLTGVRKLLDRQPVASFLDLFAQLRFQVRWGQTPRIPVTSVLGHSMMVACLAYLLTRELLTAPCDARVRNNFFGGLFHDLPEAVTRDIISPVKGAVPELSQVIGEIEKELVQREIFPLWERDWQEELTYYTDDEFSSKVFKDGAVAKVGSDKITKDFNTDAFRPIDGELIKVADDLGAFVEAFKSIEAGISTQELQDGVSFLRNKYRKKTLAGIRIGGIYEDFY